MALRATAQDPLADARADPWITLHMEAGGVEGVASIFTFDRLLLCEVGEFAIGGPQGDKADNGLSGKKLAIDHYETKRPDRWGSACH
jgi:hypothetical protein